ncbi:MAG: hypothetical protein ABSG75_09765 [Syntrophales bacterium]|jgi:hypothetical protein
MKIKSSYIIILISIFLAGVFLDQNRTPVPIKIIFGNPIQLELTLIIIVSMVVSSVMTIGVIYMIKRIKDKKANAVKPSPGER